MRTHAILALSLAATGLAAGLVPGGCSQPDIYCTTSRNHFAATYKLKSGDKDSPCAQLTGDLVGLDTYFSEGGLNGTPNYREASMAIRTAYLGDLVDYAINVAGVEIEDWEHRPNAVGDFSTELPVAEFCEVPKLKSQTVEIPDLPEVPVEDDPETPEVEAPLPPRPATSVRIDWTNFNVLVTADAQGTQFKADMKLTQDGCVAEYEVLGVAPAVGCVADEDCTCEGYPMEDDAGVLIECPAKLGSMNPGFDLKCHPDLGLCVLADDPPAYAN
jgi:hypothetical protein